LDVVVANGPPRILLGNGDGTFAAGPTGPIDWTTTESLAGGDINGDGKNDPAVTSYTAHSYYDNYSGSRWIATAPQVLVGQGDGTYVGSSYNLQGATPTVALGDLNGDGRDEIILGGGPYGTGAWVQVPDRGALVTELNGDGKADVLSPQHIFLGNG